MIKPASAGFLFFARTTSQNDVIKSRHTNKHVISMNTQVRIAAALERIANALEARQCRPARPAREPYQPRSYSLPGGMDAKLMAAKPSLSGRDLTMDDLLSACGLKDATFGQRQAMGAVARRCGFVQVRTAGQRFYRC